jgi:hypothetical protein
VIRNQRRRLGIVPSVFRQHAPERLARPKPQETDAVLRVIREGIELTTIDGTIGEVGTLLGYPNDEGVEREK